MVLRNSHFAKLHTGYLFAQINLRIKALLERHPEARIVNLGIGDTTQPIVPHVVKRLVEASVELGTVEGYRGYGPEQGSDALRKKIAHQLYPNLISPSEVYVGDGAKCEIGRLQVMFGSKSTIALQDPTYPVYVDTSVMRGRTKGYDLQQRRYQGIVYMPCVPETNFFPNLQKTPRTDLIYFCSPHNPTGAVATHSQLRQLVDFARSNQSIIIFDSAYAAFIQEKGLPRSIFEIEGARHVAIELGSFSKMAGFTGLRLGWTIVPDELCFDDGTLVKEDWSRVGTTFFNGASSIVQKGGCAVLEEEGIREVQATIALYLNNAKQIKSASEALGYPAYGAENAPYVWVKFPHKSSWDAFTELLEKAHIVTIPGRGFGPSGEGYLRFSGLADPVQVNEATKRIYGILADVNDPLNGGPTQHALSR